MPSKIHSTIDHDKTKSGQSVAKGSRNGTHIDVTRLSIAVQRVTTTNGVINMKNRLCCEGINFVLRAEHNTLSKNKVGEVC